MNDLSFADSLRALGFDPSATSDLRPPRIVLYFGEALGDNLLCTAVLRELRRRNVRPVWMMTRFPELFAPVADADAIISPPDLRLEPVIQQFGGRLIVPSYTKHDWQNDAGDPVPPAHIIAMMCHLSGITGPVALRPYFQLREEEQSFGRLSPRQIAIQSSGGGAAMSMKNKEWLPERFQEVVDALRSDFSFVQIGSASDPPLDGAMDLRGKTSVRETAAVLSHSLGFVGLVGFLMHLARAVGCRSTVVYGGRELPRQSGYSCNENISNPLQCSPCWRWNRCEYEHACMTEIRSETVVAAMRRIVSRAGQPIRDDVCDITPN
jgi:Glycosyltransferase family 9 (heptosyltransferase)